MAKLYFRYAAMNAGKSTALLQVAFNYEEQQQRVVLYTAELDDRFGVGQIASRLGLQREARTFSSRLDFGVALADEQHLACVLIDEAQFLTPGQVRQLHHFAHTRNIPVICYGIRSDFQGEPFPGAIYLLALADDLEEMKTICLCGRKATMNTRIDAHGQRVREGEQVEVGGNNRYRSVCARCFYLG